MMRLGFTWQEALDMPLNTAFAYLDCDKWRRVGESFRLKRMVRKNKKNAMVVVDLANLVSMDR